MQGIEFRFQDLSFGGHVEGFAKHRPGNKSHTLYTLYRISKHGNVKA